METKFQSPYFTQTADWAQFWQEGNQAHHLVHTIVINGMTTYVYEYPWFLNTRFLYVPAGPVLPRSGDKSEARQLLNEFYRKLKLLCVNRKCIFVKTELDHYLTDNLNIITNQDALLLLKNATKGQFDRIIPARKRIMYTHTIVLDIQNLELKNDSMSNSLLTTEKLQEFFENNLDFWRNVNEGHRSKTRKSLKQNWSWSFEKSDKNFEHFWTLYTSTSARQSFSTQPKSYFKTLYSKPQSRIIVLFSNHGTQDTPIPEAVWFGYCTPTSLIYLYGGNSEISMKYFGQYLIHLIAMAIGVQEHKAYYDLGGYDPKAGYGVFKERYKGTVVQFFGTYDLIRNPTHYSFINALINGVKILKRLRR